jgi:hypothetical protein
MYITIKVKKPSGRLLFEKDFPPHLFKALMGAEVMRLTSQGYLEGNQHYTLGLMPHYENPSEHIEPKIVKVDDTIKNKYNFNEFLLTGERVQENTPVTYFTLFILFPDKMYIRDIPVTALTGIEDRLKNTLGSIGLIKNGENIVCEYFFRLDDTQKRQREIIHAAPHKKSTLQLNVRETKKEDLPARNISSYQGQWQGSQDDDIPILIKDSTVQDIYRHAQGRPHQEIGGILIGDVYYDNQIDKIFVEINNIIQADMAVGTGASLNFSIQANEEINRIKKINFPDKSKIGWYHSHLIKVKNFFSPNFTAMFFSKQDLAVHKRFREPWQVALVVDSMGSEKWFYRWKDIEKEQIEPCQGIYVFEKFNNSEE